MKHLYNINVGYFITSFLNFTFCSNK